MLPVLMFLLIKETKRSKMPEYKIQGLTEVSKVGEIKDTQEKNQPVDY